MMGGVDLVLDLVWPGLAAGALATAILPWLRREHQMARSFLLAAGILLIVRYILWRGLATLPEAGLTLDFFAGLLFYAIETVALAGAAINLFFMCRVKVRSPEVANNIAWLAAQNPPPLVDVLICTYNEEKEILERTIIGTQAMSYPAFRVWVQCFPWRDSGQLQQ